MDMDNAIEIKGLNKTYAASGKTSEKHALKGIDLDIPKGSIFGLLGPNGAGKSTLINIMAGLVSKNSGSVRIWESDLDDDERQAKASIGIVPQEINFDPFFTPKKILDLQAGFFGVPKAERRTDELLDLVGLLDKAEATTRSLSGGMRRRLMVAKAMVHLPPILVLDEPTAGVDIELRQELWENVRALNDQGVTILLTTHYLEEAQEMCDRIAVINNGEVVANDKTENILKTIENKEVSFILDRDISDIPKRLESFAPEKIGKRTIKLRYAPSKQPVGEFIDAIQKGGYFIEDIQTEESDLEDVFLQLVKKA
jgi:ABC-2 type transport system ATP-binding protein